jgi:glucokinase
MKYYLGIDLGGTNIAMGLVDESYRILSQISCKTNAPRPAEDICNDIILLYHTLLKNCKLSESDIEWIGIGSPGIIYRDTVSYASNLDFHDVPLSHLLKQRFHKKIFLENDGSAAAYGEFLAGAGKGYHSLVIITLGTGVGGGIIMNDRICSGFNGAGGELGHMIIESNGRKCSCGKNGCLEAYCSASALIKSTKQTMKKHPESILWELCDGDLSAVNGKTAFDGMRRNDPVAAQIVKNFIFHLSIGVSNMINLLQPEIICIGGGISKEGDTIITPLTEYIKQQTYPTEQTTQIMTAKLGNDAGIIGAAMLGKQA